MIDKFWNMRHDFLKSAPRKIVSDCFDDDKKNYVKMKVELSKEVALLDDSLTLFVTSLQGGYRSLNHWKDDVSLKAAVPMANSALNYLLLARHAILLGYFAEARDLLRSCHERITRCYLFYADANEAQKFLSGKKLCNRSEQKYVDEKVATILKNDNALKELRTMYRSQSSFVHPNLESLSVRTNGSETEKLSDRVVKYPLFGGLLSPDLGKLYIYAVIQSTLFALSVIRVIFEETSGNWDKEYKRIRGNYNAFIKEEQNSEARQLLS